jgi:hypothetical protein
MAFSLVNNVFIDTVSTTDECNEIPVQLAVAISIFVNCIADVKSHYQLLVNNQALYR